MTHQFLASLCSFLCLTFAIPAFGQIQRFDLQKTRADLLYLKENPPIKKIELQGEFQNARQEKLYRFFKEEIEPQLESQNRWAYKYYALKLLMDSGSYDSPQELKAWQAELLEATSKLNQMDVSPEWKKTLRLGHQLAEGLTGDLPELVQTLYGVQEQDAFSESMTPKMDELDRLENEFDVAINQAPSNAILSDYIKELRAVVLARRSGEMSFDEASKRLRANSDKGGYTAIAFEAIQKYPDHLNRAAVLRSELAKSKGYKTWAEYRLANDMGYSEEYRGVQKQREFLLKVIKTLAGPVKQTIDKRIQDLNIPVSDVYEDNVALVLPHNLNYLAAYFPPETITDKWLETMIESGFGERALSQILVDDEVRNQKNSTGAYMMGVTAPYVAVSVLSANTLNFENPDRNSDLWKPGFAYILQSYKAGGVGDMETMFHEGGHALEKSLKFKVKSNPEAYAYVETPSMTMEHFMLDPVVLLNKATPIDGKLPTLEEIQEVLLNNKTVIARGLLSSASMSLFDIDLWNYDYSKPGALTFLERVEQLHARGEKQTLSRGSWAKKYPDFYNLLATSHFYSGAVRNIGYVFAEMSSMQMANFLSDELEKTTGRRSWYKQPSLAGLFANNFFAEGWKYPFPQNIEKITGKKYEPELILQGLLDDLSQCADLLK